MSSNIELQRICQHCGNEFTARTTTTMYCSHRCNSAAYKAKQRSVKVEASNKQTHQIRTQPIEELKSKVFLSIAETCKLIGISRRTVYRMIERNDLTTGKAGKRTIIRRSDLEQLLFEKPEQIKQVPESNPEPKQYEISECYNMAEIQNKFRISEKALYDTIKRNGIPKIKKGRFAYVPKIVIDKILS